MSLDIPKLMHLFDLLVRKEQGIPTAEQVFENRNPEALVEFFHKIKLNYYIILQNGAVLSSFEFEKPGVMRVDCEDSGAPYLCLFHKDLEQLFHEQTVGRGGYKPQHWMSE